MDNLCSWRTNKHRVNPPMHNSTAKVSQSSRLLWDKLQSPLFLPTAVICFSPYPVFLLLPRGSSPPPLSFNTIPMLLLIHFRLSCVWSISLSADNGRHQHTKGPRFPPQWCWKSRYGSSFVVAFALLLLLLLLLLFSSSVLWWGVLLRLECCCLGLLLDGMWNLTSRTWDSERFSSKVESSVTGWCL